MEPWWAFTGHDFPYEEFAGLTPTQAEEKYNQLLEGLSQYLRQHDVPAAIIAKMLTVSSSENYLLSTEEVDGIGMRQCVHIFRSC